jgi:dihydrofolate reductase
MKRWCTGRPYTPPPTNRRSCSTGRGSGRRPRRSFYSRTFAEPRSARTRIEREFNPDAVRLLKATANHDITVDGPELAGHAIRAGLVDEFQMILCPVIVGGGKRFFPDGVRLDLDLPEERRFGNGVAALRYAVRC